MAVASANATGKSWLAARAAAWFLTNYVPSQVITTAPTDRQVRHILWREIAAIHAAAEAAGKPLGGELLTKYWRFSEEHFALGFSTRDYDPDAFQGIHGAHLLVIVDEAAGITEAMWEAIKSVLRGAHTRLLAIGNPTSLSGTFYEAFRSDRWWTTHISAFETPNVIEGRVVIPGLVTLEDIEDSREDFGEGSFLWEARVLGQFPRAVADTLIPIADIEAAANEEFEPSGDVEVGADIARYGADETVFVARAGPWAFDAEAYSRQGTMETAGRLALFIRRHQAKRVKVDVVGLGAGVYDRLCELRDLGELPAWLDIVAMNAGAPPQDRKQYADAGSEWWGTLAQRLEARAVGGPVFGQKKVLAQLSGRKKSYTSTGQLKLEPKDKMRARGERSPDWGDALAMAFADVGPARDDRAAQVLRGLKVY